MARDCGVEGSRIQYGHDFALGRFGQYLPQSGSTRMACGQIGVKNSCPVITRDLNENSENPRFQHLPATPAAQGTDPVIVWQRSDGPEGVFWPEIGYWPHPVRSKAACWIHPGCANL